jgi:alcohol dehydrogenase class IV
MASENQLLLIFIICQKLQLRQSFYYRIINSSFIRTIATQKLQKEAAERVKNQFLLPILDPRSNTSEFFNTFSSLIKIPSIMIEVHGEVNQNQKISEVLKGSQISNQQ